MTGKRGGGGGEDTKESIFPKGDNLGAGLWRLYRVTRNFGPGRLYFFLMLDLPAKNAKESYIT